jgi:hypothetical protein
VKLRAAAQSSILAYWITTWSVLRECRQIQQSLSELPHGLLEMMSPQLTRKFANIIRNYNSTVRKLKSRFWEEEHISLCVTLFRCVLTPYVYQYNDDIILETFTQKLVLQTLGSVKVKLSLCLTN